jgi:hypothetical protein
VCNHHFQLTKLNQLKVMVQIVGYNLRTPKEGKPYITLEIEGSVEMVQSQNTGRFYATVRRCVISSTFDEITAARMVGKQMPGTIERVPCEPYEFTIRETGEQTLLSYRWDYQPEGRKRTFATPKTKVEDLSADVELPADQLQTAETTTN